MNKWKSVMEATEEYSLT